ncbi:Inner membrane protein OS=Castellaniella defragrans OX=75697 GN=HNR28_001775 PE=4 SV=1 [Castellaniella defragrans]
MPFGPKHPTFRPTPYGYSRRSRGIPRWLLLLITGIVLGAGGVLFLQRSYGPQRLTIEQSEQLRTDLNTSNMENQRLTAESKKLHETLAQAQKDEKSAQQQMEQSRKHAADMQAGVANLIEAIPGDPRGGTPGIRAGDVVFNQTGLHYQFLLIQEIPKGQTEAPNLRGTVKLIAAGSYPNGNHGSQEVTTQPLDMGRYTVIKGDWTDAPKSFRPFQVTMQITADGSDKVISTRTFRVTRR